MDPKLPTNAPQGMNLNTQQNPQTPNMMMSFPQQQQQQPDMQQFNPLAGLNNMPFNAPGMANLNYAQTDFNNLDPTDLSNVNAFIQGNPNFGGNVNMSLLQQQALQQQQQQQHLRQNSHPQPVYSPQNLMGLQGNSPAMQAQYQNRGPYHNNGSMMVGSPQVLMLQQQQQQQAAAMALNRAKQSPSQSPAMNSNISGNVLGSPSVTNSPHIAGARVAQDYTASPMNPIVHSPAQNFQHSNGVSPSPQMTRVIPSQTNNRHMQQQQNFLHQQQQHQQHLPPKQRNSVAGSPSLNNNSSSASYSSPQIQQQQVQQQSPIPRQSATPASHHSTPRQQQQASTPKTSMANPVSADYSSLSLQQSQSPHVPFESSASPSRVNQQSHVDNSNQPQQQPSPHVQPSTSAPLKTPQQKITYIPKTRNVDTYGGVDLKYFDKFEIKPLTPHLNELGIIDIQALIMSLKSGQKMEVTNALNVLTVLTTEPQVYHHHHQQQQQQPNLPLAQCDDLLDVLLDYLEQDILGTSSRYVTGPTASSNAATTTTNPDTPPTLEAGLTYTGLFDMSLAEMKSLIPRLEDSTSDIWMSLRERCLCIFNILRNLSFMVDNVEHLARHKRFVNLLCELTASSSNYDKHRGDGKDVTGREVWFVGIRLMDTLDYRKSVLMIFSNICIFLTLRDKKTAAVLVHLVHDFLVNGPDTYYSLLAIEIWTKLTVNYENRQLLYSLIPKQQQQEATDGAILTVFEDIWLELTSVVRRDFFSSDGRVMHAMTSNQLATLELIVMGLYNIVAIIQPSNMLRQKFLNNNKGIGMMIMRLCITLAESGNPQFSLVTKRGMELIRALICGGDGIYKRSSNHNRSQQQHRPLAALSQHYQEPKKEDKDKMSIPEIGNRLLDVSVLREKLMLSMLKPTTDPEILRELSDIVALIDDEPSV